MRKRGKSLVLFRQDCGEAETTSDTRGMDVAVAGGVFLDGPETSRFSAPLTVFDQPREPLAVALSTE